jgi:hypothetical protein
MLLAGLKVTQGLVVRLTILSCVAALGLMGAEPFDRRQKKRRRQRWETKARVQRHAMPRFHERAVFNILLPHG